MIRVGVLGLQGSVAEHMKLLSAIEGVEAVEVKTREDLDSVSGLIIPGGESTTIGKLLKDFNLVEPIKSRAQAGMPLWGTCAGMILMAKELVNEDYTHLGLMNIAVRRNAYGSQLDSFLCNGRISEVSKEDIPLVFIRAPWVERIFGEAFVLHEVNKQIVAVKEKNMIATSFHPELTENIEFHKYFVELIRKNVNK